MRFASRKVRSLAKISRDNVEAVVAVEADAAGRALAVGLEAGEHHSLRPNAPVVELEATNRKAAVRQSRVVLALADDQRIL